MKQDGNILLVANWESDVGYAWWLIENFWRTIADNLKSKGIDSILTYPRITNIPQKIKESDIQVVEFNFKQITANNLLKLRNIIKKYNIKYVYLTDSPFFNWKYILLRILGVKIIIIHDHTPGDRTPPRNLKYIIKKLIQKIPFYTADHFIAVTEFVRDRMIKVACIPEYKCHCAPNGIIPINPAQKIQFYANKIFNIPNDRIIVVTTGRATYYKRIDFFIRCANTVINEHNKKNFHFLYCGDGPDIDDFKKQVSDLSLNDNFTFAGRRSDIRDILPSCHIGLHTSLGEVGYSLSILEYMSASLITMVPDNPSTNLATKDNETGFIYKANDHQAATSILLDYLKHQENYTDIGNNASLYVKESLNLKNTNKALERIITQILFPKADS